VNERSKRPTGRPWDDQRLAEAYRALAARPAPQGLTDATVVAASEKAHRSGRGARGFALPTMRWTRAALAGTALGLVAVAILVAGLALRSAPASTRSAAPAMGGLPKTVDGLTVRTVSQVLAAEVGGRIQGDGLIAVEGWINPMPFPMCPYEPAHPALEDTCTSQKLLVTETRQELVVVETASDSTTMWANPPSGPYLYARELDGAYVDPLLPAGDPTKPYRPLQSVLVGHFHDARAAECSADQRAKCDSAFVVDQLAWVVGKSLGPSVWIGGDSTGAVLKPRLTPDGVVAALRPSLDPSDAVVSIAVVTLGDITTLTGKGLQAPGNGADLLWYVRVAGPAPRFPPMAWAGGDSGWMVLDDASGRLRGAGGWGFVSVATASFPPSPRPSLSGGLYALPTTNWLSGGICAGVGLDAVLRGSPNDPRVAWLENKLGGQSRTEVTWPAGYRARFSPNIEILDENGNVVLREGDAVTGACGNNPDTGMIYLEPPFR
jgi:hypothetical protein